MNKFLLIVFATSAFALTSVGGQNQNLTTIRQVDFRNFTYDWSDPEISESHDTPWHWLAYDPDSRFRMVRGLHHFYLPGSVGLERTHSPRISVSAMTYGDLDGDGVEEAVISLNYSTGGTMNWDYLYVYKLVSGRAKLMARMRTGSRGYGGLIRANVWDEVLVVDFADPDKATADCCSEGFVRLRYRWQGDHFVEEEDRDYGKLDLSPGPPRPKFSDYPVKTVYRGKPAPAIITGQFRMFRTRIRQGADSSVEFAGHYTLPRWGCGTDCNVFVIVDSRTGKVFDGLGIAELPFTWLSDYGEEAMMRMEFYPDSRLLKINACPNEENCGLYDYIMVDGKGLKLIRKELLPEGY